MFGVVPKTMWERTPANELNQIVLGTNTVVVRTGKKTVVIETGIGNKLPEKLRRIFDARQKLLGSFRAAGIKPEEVDIVINSHLHFDHCGWNTTQTRRWPRGSHLSQCALLRAPRRSGTRPPAARARSGELYQRQLRPAHRQRPDDPDRRQSRRITRDCARGLCEVFPGHTAQMMAVMLDSGGRRACYISDLIPTSAHLNMTWGMGYDLDPLTCIEERKRFFGRAIPEQWLVLFTHDHHHPMGYVMGGRARRN